VTGITLDHGLQSLDLLGRTEWTKADERTDCGVRAYRPLSGTTRGKGLASKVLFFIKETVENSEFIRRINPDKKIQSVLQKTRDSSRQAVSSIRSAG
jgi:hypothetical protein